jgi:hypothetical protein
LSLRCYCSLCRSSRCQRARRRSDPLKAAAVRRTFRLRPPPLSFGSYRTLSTPT